MFGYSRNRAAVSVLLLALASCSVFSGQETAGQYTDDATITSKIKEALLADPQVKSYQIHVETMHGVVQLTGFVGSPKSEARAVELARRVPGVTSVKDSIAVQEPGTSSN